jgi:nucleoside-diphosphate-sugar epimerase
MPLPLARIVAGAGELISSLIKKPPLLPRGQLHFLQWGARPSSARAQRELGWTPTPFTEGVKATIQYLGLIS